MDTLTSGNLFESLIAVLLAVLFAVQLGLVLANDMLYESEKLEAK